MRIVAIPATTGIERAALATIPSMPHPDTDVVLTAHNTLGLPCRAAFLTHVRQAALLPELLAKAGAHRELSDLPWRVLGGGSNLVLPGVLRAFVLKVEIPGRQILGEESGCVWVKGGGGENWHAFVQWTLSQGLYGLENLSLIPGTVGASPIQNIGAYGVEAMDLIHEVEAVELRSGQTRIYPREACGFSYRDSVFKHALDGQVLITSVTFRLTRAFAPKWGNDELKREIAAAGLTTPTARQMADAVIAIRTRKLPDPALIGNAGSFFKNPVVAAGQCARLKAKFPGLIAYPMPDGSSKLAAGWLIDQCGWKGKRLGRAGMYEKQALVLVNHGGATASEVTGLYTAVMADVRATFGVELEPEPVRW